MNNPSQFLNTSVLRKSVLLLAATGLLSISQFSFAAATCKGMQQDACSSENSCSWVNSYTTKTGKKINAYCRNKSNPGAKKSVPDSSSAGKSDKQG
ncbi:MAG: hypothetical protein ACN4GR_11605 [Arenicellales bacterium]